MTVLDQTSTWHSFKTCSLNSLGIESMNGIGRVKRDPYHFFLTVILYNVHIEVRIKDRNIHRPSRSFPLTQIIQKWQQKIVRCMLFDFSVFYLLNAKLFKSYFDNNRQIWLRQSYDLWKCWKIVIVNVCKRYNKVNASPCIISTRSFKGPRKTFSMKFIVFVDVHVQYMYNF